MAFVSHGVSFDLRSECPGLLSPLAGVLPPRTRSAPPALGATVFSVLRSPAEADALDLYRDETHVCTERDPQLMRRRVASQVRAHVAIHARPRVFIHAGAVAFDEQGVLIPGCSFSGKSTLVAELVRAGATYYSDDYAVLDTSGRLHPFAKPISLRPRGSTVGVDHPLKIFGGVAGRRPIDVGTICVTRFKPGAEWQPAIGTAGDGTLALMESAVGAFRRPEAALAAAERAASGSQVLCGIRGEAAETAAALRAMLA